MKKSIFLLFLLLMGCAPVATVPPTVTPLLPSPTITPSPTATPEPTATPSAPREVEGGGVEVFENGKWVELKAPEGIWGPVQGTRVVLVDGGEGNQEAYTQMKLQYGMVDAQDGDKLINVARYDRKTKKWVVVDSTVVRATALDGEEIYNRNYNFDKHSDQEARVDAFGSRGTVLAMRIAGGDNPNVKFLMLYKKHIAWVSPDQIGASWLIKGPPLSRENRLLDPSNVDVQSAIELIKLVDSSNSNATPRVASNMNFFELQPGATLESCTKPLFVSRRDYGSKFQAWCENELAKGANRPRPNRGNLDWIFQGGADPTSIDENFDVLTLTNLLDTYENIGAINGTHFVLSFTEQ